MSRSKRFLQGLVASYAALGINILYTLASVPLALHYLNKEEFGIWALVIQLSGYLSLIELGMRGSVARTLSDHKDHIEDGMYGSTLKTGTRVFAIQGAIVFILGVALAFCGPSLLCIPPHLATTFRILMGVQSLLSGINLACSTLGSPLWCHQRLDLNAHISSITLVVSFVALWISFSLGFHVYSLVAGGIVSTLIAIFSAYWICKRLGFFPPHPYKGCYQSKLFREMLDFGSGLFVLNLGSQLTSASQIILISRMLGVESATVWSVATKLFNMAQQVVAKVMDASAGGLAEIFVRGEHELLKERFKDIISISAVIAVTASSAIILMNGPFIDIWTMGKISWNPWNNLILGICLFTSAIIRCHVSLSGITKQIDGIKYINLIEGLVFVGASIIFVPKTGIQGLLIAMLLSNVGITGLYSIRKTAAYFKIKRISVTGWIARPTALLGLVCILSISYHTLQISNLSIRLEFMAGAGVFLGLMVPLIFWFSCQHELRSQSTSFFFRLLRKMK